ncbi:phage tail tape measure protein [Pseudomonas sp. 22189]|uniref:phage tail tape measure protein n=1 Tax=Pseudomonas sp. 22189 TaxID=3453889 RepID=UPI003F8283A2
MADKFQLKALITGVDKLSPMLGGIRKNVAGFRKQLESSGLGKISFQDVLQGGAFAAPFIAGAKAAIDFESSMADVKKVVNFDTPEQFQQMSKDVLDLSEKMPMAATGIAAIVAAGGQAGFARGELKQFAEDAVKMGIAFDQTAEQSGDMMAKWRTSFKLTQPEVVALADKINYLSNTGPSSAAQIADIVTRIGPLGKIAGLASGQIAAMGATLAGVGVPSEVAATGLKNFMLALTKGKAATKEQTQAFKSLRLDVKKVSLGMQKDAQGTMLDVLERVSKVAPDKQAGLLTQLFGSESIAAIAPLLTNLDLLRKSFGDVGVSGDFAGSMTKEYTERSKTTANAMQLLRSRVTRLGIEIGNVLLPPLNDIMALLGPIVSQVGQFAAANPGLVKGVLGAGLAFGVLKLGVMGAIVAMKLFDAATRMSPVGLLIRGLALAAGLLIANWQKVSPFFSALWNLIKAVAQRAQMAWDKFTQTNPVLAKSLMGAAAGFLAMRVAMLAANVAGKIFSVTLAVVRGAVIAATVATRIFNLVAKANPFVLIASLIAMAAGALIANWEPALQWFKDAWDKISGWVKSIMGAFGMVGDAGVDGAVNSATNAVNNLTMQVAPVRAGNGDGTLLRPRPEGERWSPQGDALVQNAMAASQPKLQGELVMRFENPPPGLQVDKPQTNQPGLNIKPNVGTRTVGVMRP